MPSHVDSQYRVLTIYYAWHVCWTRGFRIDLVSSHAAWLEHAVRLLGKSYTSTSGENKSFRRT
eukprot:scaffold292150_cov19-Prasinocladus_malaysianus.AAC.1